MITVKYAVVLISVFLWIGFVCAISFIKAWLKFRAPGVSLAIGPGIGRLVFSSLNKIEWVFAIAIAANYFLERNFFKSNTLLVFVIPLLVLNIQSFWLLPELDARAELHI